MTVYTHTHTHIYTYIGLCFGGRPPATMQNGALLHEDSAAPAILVRAFTVLAVRPSGASIVTRLSRCSTCTPPPQRSQSPAALRRGPALHTVANRSGGVSGVPLSCMYKLHTCVCVFIKCIRGRYFRVGTSLGTFAHACTRGLCFSACTLCAGVVVVVVCNCLGTFRELRYRVSRSRVSFQIKLSSSLIKLSPCPCLSVFLVTHAFTPLQDDNYKHKEWRRKPQG